mmetsp:Transcript_12096/g.34655  ORF Transcript_12096/g.34655 Transcript_12096/m.34655 type:complete len:683 (+) Transcript_12096:619-2667(+)
MLIEILHCLGADRRRIDALCWERSRFKDGCRSAASRMGVVLVDAPQLLRLRSCGIGSRRRIGIEICGPHRLESGSLGQMLRMVPVALLGGSRWRGHALLPHGEGRGRFVEPNNLVKGDLRHRSFPRSFPDSDRLNSTMTGDSKIDSFVRDEASATQWDQRSRISFVINHCATSSIVLLLLIPPIGIFQCRMGVGNGGSDRVLGVAQPRLVVVPVKVSDCRRPFLEVSGMNLPVLGVSVGGVLFGRVERESPVIVVHDHRESLAEVRRSPSQSHLVARIVLDLDEPSRLPAVQVELQGRVVPDDCVRRGAPGNGTHHSGIDAGLVIVVTSSPRVLATVRIKAAKEADRLGRVGNVVDALHVGRGIPELADLAPQLGLGDLQLEFGQLGQASLPVHGFDRQTPNANVEVVQVQVQIGKLFPKGIEQRQGSMGVLVLVAIAVCPDLVVDNCIAVTIAVTTALGITIPPGSDRAANSPHGNRQVILSVVAIAALVSVGRVTVFERRVLEVGQDNAKDVGRLSPVPMGDQNLHLLEAPVDAVRPGLLPVLADRPSPCGRVIVAHFQEALLHRVDVVVLGLGPAHGRQDDPVVPLQILHENAHAERHGSPRALVGGLGKDQREARQRGAGVLHTDSVLPDAVVPGAGLAGLVDLEDLLERGNERRGVAHHHAVAADSVLVHADLGFVV